ncbi:MAG: hypothetical protein HY356_06520 [Gammaproteobacteria bacterium]|nr:hypothetical protein [Gammaproteobacteria bacterium]
MKKNLIICVALLVLTTMTQTVSAEQLAINKDDTIVNVLEGQKGKKVTVKLVSGEELSGTVTNVTDKLLHLGQLTGKEFYDAVIPVKDVSAIIVRTKE